MAIVCDLVMKNLRQHEVSQALAVGDFDQCCAVFCKYRLIMLIHLIQITQMLRS